MDVGCYCVSAMRLLAGEPERVRGHQVTRRRRRRALSGTLGFAGGVLGVLRLRARLSRPRRWRSWATHGSLFLADPWHSRSPRIERAAAGRRSSRSRSRPGDPYACELEDFAAAVRGERPHPFGREDAVGQARTIAALYRSAEFGADAVPVTFRCRAQ